MKYKVEDYDRVVGHNLPMEIEAANVEMAARRWADQAIEDLTATVVVTWSTGTPEAYTEEP